MKGTQFSNIWILSLACILYSFNIISVSGTQQQVINQRILNEIFGKSYDKNVQAFSGGTGDEATIVSMNMYVRSMTFDSINMNSQMTLTFRMAWLDKRLDYENKPNKPEYLSLRNTSEIWMPDLFFSNEISGYFHNLLNPNMYIRIWPNGQILYSTRITLKLNCPMNFKEFPHDSQICTLRMASYGFTTKFIIFRWTDEAPIVITPELNMPDFALENVSTDYCDSQTSTGTYSCLLVVFRIKRAFSRYLVQVYIPCTMFVIIAWLSLWLEPFGVNGLARLVLSTSTLLVLSMVVQQLQDKVPNVSYTKAIDVWTGMCLTFVFSSLAEFIIVHYLSRGRGNENEKEDDDDEGKSQNVELGNNEPSSVQAQGQVHGEGAGNQGGGIKKLFKLPKKTPSAIDFVARIVYLVAFLLFLIIYSV